MKLDPIVLLALLWFLSQSKRAAPGPGPLPPKPPPPGVSPWSDDEMRAFIETVNPIIGSTVFALNVYQVESGNNPKATNASTGNVGLPQITPKYLSSFGWTAGPQAFANAGVRGQLPVIGGLLLSQVKSMGGMPTRVAELYHANFYPATLGQAYVVRSKAKGGSAGEDAAYKANALLDVNRDGIIDETDLDSVLSKAAQTSTFRALQAQMVRLTGEEPVAVAKPKALPPKKTVVAMKPATKA